jgi:hypothetical protein
MFSSFIRKARFIEQLQPRFHNISFGCPFEQFTKLAAGVEGVEGNEQLVKPILFHLV